MKYTELTTAQAAAFQQRVQPMLRFLLLCRKRLDARGFDPNGKLYRAVSTAYDAMYHLHMELHYESCGRGMGRPPKEE
jgi:hypothetical protein